MSPGQEKSREGAWLLRVPQAPTVPLPRPSGSHGPSSLHASCPVLVLTSLTRTPASTVCLISMSVSGHWGAVGLHPDRQVPAFPGEWEGGVGE